MNYTVYRFSKKEYFKYILLYLLLDAVVSELFFHSWIALALLLPGLPLFFQDRKRSLQKRRVWEMRSEFLTGMQLVNASLQAGYAVENAFREALKELTKLYDKDAFVVREFQYIVSQVRLNRTIEALLLDLGVRSGVEDIQNFAEVFYTAKRTGGDLMAVIQNTVSCIRQRQETQMEIETSLSGKMLEQTMMSALPLLILGYVKLTSPGFLDVMYGNLLGTSVMLVCFLTYLAACFWGRKIMDIQV